jgi:hypothetical protein
MESQGLTERQGFVSSAGNRDFCFVTEYETGEIFFCHLSRIKDSRIPDVSDRVIFEALPKQLGERKRPIVSLEVLND